MAEPTTSWRIAFIDSWHRSAALGSGSAVGIGGLARALEQAGHTVTHFPPLHDDRAGTLQRLRFNLALPRRLDPSSFDLIVGFDFDGWRVTPAPGAPYAVCLKGILADEARFERGVTRLRLAALSRLERRNTRKADAVMVTSAYCRDVAVTRYGVSPQRVRIVPEGIDWIRWADGSGQAGSAPDRPPVVLSVARQYPRKNTRRLLRAMAVVRGQVPRVRCRIVGGGPELPRLQRIRADLGLQDCVELLGEVDDARLREAYRSADVFCLPSLQEGFGIAFLEAMASGLPVIASRDAAVPEVVPDGEAGLLVDGREPAAIATALVELLTNRRLRRRLGDYGRQAARAYDWPLVADRFLREVGAVRRHRGADGW